MTVVAAAAPRSDPLTQLVANRVKVDQEAVQLGAPDRTRVPRGGQRRAQPRENGLQHLLRLDLVMACPDPDRLGEQIQGVPVAWHITSPRGSAP